MDVAQSASLVDLCSVPPRRIDVGRLTMNAVVAGNGRPIVLIHGLGWDNTLWGRQVERLSDRYKVIAGDTRGHGGTDKPAGPYSIDQFAEDWAALMDHLALGQALVLGFSLGGMIAQRLALMRPDLVGALILASTTCRVPESSRNHMEERISAMRAAGPAAAAQVAARSVFSEAWRDRNPDRLASFVAWRAGQDHTALVEAMRATADFDVTAELGNVNVPTLVLTGTGDTLMPPSAQSLIGQYLPAAQSASIAAGHMISVEEPDQFDLILENFLARHWSPQA